MVNSEAATTKSDQPMDGQQRELYERIQAFSFDQSDAQLSFTKRLARDNGWTVTYAQRVIEEYKKFAFLAVAAGHPVTPSDQVDQAWHLHLSYTRSYWDEFCSQVLQTPLHHEPTQGGEAENQKFEDWYSKTLESYERFFGEAPQTEIWSTPADRFGRDLHFVRVNTQQNQVLQKKLQPRKNSTADWIFLPIVLGVWGSGILTNSVNSPRIIIFIVITLAGYGLIKFLNGLSSLKNPTDSSNGGRKNPSNSSNGGGWSNYSDGSGCGGGLGNDGWGWGNSSGHHSDGGCGDSSGGDSGGGDGGGCGGGGCSGGGCGGCGGGD